jgi:Tfp pilus assembly PilM family ATPase
MSRLLALEWDSREARVVAANLRPGELRVEQMFCVPLPAGDDAAAAGAALAAALAERKLGKSPALVALARSQVELKALTLPPAPDDELPSMARLQAVREFTSLGDDWPLDYLPLSDDPAAQREVLAAAISPETMERTTRVCAPAGLEVSRYVVRPFAAASRFERTADGRACMVRLLIDLLPGEADLTVMVERRVVFARTARLSGDVLATPEEARSLVGEVRRTLAAAHTQLGARRVEAVYILGATPQHATLCAKLQAELSLPCRSVDPLAGTGVGREATSELAEGTTGRFAALLGALWDEAEAVAPAIDFLHPRRPPPPKRSKRPLALAAVAAGLVLLFGAVLLIQIISVSLKIAAETPKAAESGRLATQIAEVQKELDPYEDWQASDFNWLRELALMSQKLPNPDEVIFKQLNIMTDERVAKALRDERKKRGKVVKGGADLARKAAGKVTFNGLAVSEEKAYAIGRGGDERHRIEVPTISDNKDDPKYKVAFQGSVVLAPREVDKEPLVLPPRREPEDDKAAATTAATGANDPQ